MAEMELKCAELGMLPTNVYFLQNKETKELIIVDPADNEDIIKDIVAKMEGRPVAILLTHGHFDHILAAEEIRDYYNIPVIAHEAEKVFLTDAKVNNTAMYTRKKVEFDADIYAKDNDEFEYAGFKFKVIHTPGHTPGCCCYYFPEQKVLMSGDTLFKLSYGRVDFPLSSPRDMMESLHRLFTEIPDDVNVYPGHMEMTKMSLEKRFNPGA